MNITFEWSANTDADLAGYKIYYKAGFNIGPYNGTDADQGISPITIPIGALSDPNNPEYTLTGLDPDKDYLFVATAYDTEGLESSYCYEISTDEVDPSISPPDSGGGGGGCFIATAAYGSPMSSKVKILCQFRDRHLRSNTFGKGLIALYERHSPYLANRISKSEYLKSAVRWTLWPAIGVAYVTVQTSLEQKLIMLVIMMMVCFWVVFFFKRKRLRAAHYRALNL